MNVVVSCEVGGDGVPAQLIESNTSLTQARQRAEATRQHAEAKRSATKSAAKKGKSKRKLVPGKLPAELGHDSAARYVAQRMSDRLYAPLIANEHSLELIDVTRSLHHRQLFPPLTRSWPAADRERLIQQIHTPYRERIKAAIAQMFVHFPYVIHLSVRSFDLRHNGKYRRADVGLLYDPAVDDEVDFCLDWIDEMYDELPMLRVRRNYPRRGTTDSITKAMRSEFAAKDYIGVEVQINRAWANRTVPIRDEVIDGMCRTLLSLTAESQSEAA